MRATNAWRRSLVAVRAHKPGGGGSGGGGGSQRETAPDAPRNLTATAGDQTVQLAWSTPVNDGGTPIVRYEYRQQAGDGPLGAWQILAGDPPPTAYTVTGLTNGVSYTFEVRAVNRREASPPSEAARATPEPERAALAVAIVGVPEVALAGASYELTAQSDAEEALGYAWRVAYGEGGSVEPTDTQTVVWTAPAGVTVAWIRVDVTREEDGATAGQSAYVRVEVPDQTRLTLRAAPAPAEGGAPVTVTATLDAPAPADGTTVTLTTGGTATRDTDYTLSSTTITLAAGETAGTVTLTVIDDAEADDGETIVLDAASTIPALTAAPLTLTIDGQRRDAGAGAPAARPAAPGAGADGRRGAAAVSAPARAARGLAARGAGPPAGGRARPPGGVPWSDATPARAARVTAPREGPAGIARARPPGRLAASTRDRSPPGRAPPSAHAGRSVSPVPPRRRLPRPRSRGGPA